MTELAAIKAELAAIKAELAAIKAAPAAIKAELASVRAAPAAPAATTAADTLALIKKLMDHNVVFLNEVMKIEKELQFLMPWDNNNMIRKRHELAFAVSRLHGSEALIRSILESHAA
jgi:multidrug resistance efflux pump